MKIFKSIKNFKPAIYIVIIVFCLDSFNGYSQKSGANKPKKSNASKSITVDSLDKSLKSLDKKVMELDKKAVKLDKKEDDNKQIITQLNTSATLTSESLSSSINKLIEEQKDIATKLDAIKNNYSTKKHKDEVTNSSNCKVIEIQFNERCKGCENNVSILKNVSKIREGDFYQIKIKGINQNLYKIGINHIDTTVSAPLTLPTFTNFNIENGLEKLVGGLESIVQLGDLEKLKNLKKISTPSSEPTHPGSKNDSLACSQKLKCYLDSINELKKELIAVNKNIYTSYQDIKSLLLESLGIDFVNTNKNFHKKFLRDFYNQKVQLLNLKLKVRDLEHEIKKNANDSTCNFRIFNELDTIHNELLTQIDYSINFISDENIFLLLKAVVTIENNSSSEYCSLPFQFIGEQAKVDVSIIPRYDSFNLQSYSTQFRFPLNNIEYNYVSPSYYFSSIHDEIYSSRDTSFGGSTQAYFIKEEKNSYEMGLATLFNKGEKFSKNQEWGWQLSLGVGVSMTKSIRPRLLFGGGLSYGNKHMIALNFGLIFGNVERLSSATPKNFILPKEQSVTVSKLDCGIFLSVGYIFHL